MKKLLAFLMLASVCTFAAEEKLSWNPDFKAAQKAAAADGKLMFVLFTGSDWCPWCVKLDKEILSQPKMTKYLNKNFILYKADFPRRNYLDEATVQSNRELQRKYQKNVPGYPTILILDKDGNVAGKAGYQRGGPKAMIQTLDAIQKSAK